MVSWIIGHWTLDIRCDFSSLLITINVSVSLCCKVERLSEYQKIVTSVPKGNSGTLKLCVAMERQSKRCSSVRKTDDTVRKTILGIKQLYY